MPPQKPEQTVQNLIAELARGSTSSGLSFNTAAIQQLKAIGPEAIDPLVEALKAETPWARANAAMALCAIGDGRATVVEALSQAWLDPNGTVSAAARLALMRLPHPSEPELMNKVHRRVDAKLREIREQACRSSDKAEGHS